jgi:hypothetical protein
MFTLFDEWAMGEDFLVDAWDPNIQIQRRKKSETPRDIKEKNRELMQFDGDTESLSRGSSPGLAWFLLWHGEYSNMFGPFVCEGVRKWGYLMWDSDRIMHSNLEEHLENHMDEHMGDPRPHIHHILYH